MPESIAQFAREHAGWLYALTVISGLTFVISLLAVPWLLARVPADYFVRDRPHRSDHDGRWVLWLLRKIFKNVVALLLLLAGMLMLGLPGQGLLTILIGLLLLDFPGKRRFERNLIRRPHVHQAVNWLRERHGSPPLLLEPFPHDPGQIRVLGTNSVPGTGNPKSTEPRTPQN